jgi:30S ribosomal protein S31
MGTPTAKGGWLHSDPEKAILGFFRVENREVNPRFSPFSSRGDWKMAVKSLYRSSRIFTNCYQESIMGQGDKKTRKGKIWRGSYGNTRKHKVAKKKPAPGLAKGKKK